MGQSKAYTGAVSDRAGAFEAAHGGTLFLDEVGNLSADAQKLLLSVLQDGRITRLGDLRERPVDVKLVVATNENLAAMVKDGTFRADLYMRLNPSTAIRLPTLTERGLELDTLVDFAVRSALSRPQLRELLDYYRTKNRLQGTSVRTHLGPNIPNWQTDQIVLLFSDRCLRHFRRYSWPGNLREFFLVIENALLFALSEIAMADIGRRSDVIQIRPRLIKELLLNAQLDEPQDGGVSGTKFAVNVVQADSLNKVAQECERQYFEALYLQYKGDFTKMAEVLLGDREHARKVQLRFNQLGLKVRALRSKIS